MFSVDQLAWIQQLVGDLFRVYRKSYAFYIIFSLIRSTRIYSKQYNGSFGTWSNEEASLLDTEEIVGAEELRTRKRVLLGKKVFLEPLGNCEDI